jgi:uncharacterized protein (DUF2225 family)
VASCRKLIKSLTTHNRNYYQIVDKINTLLSENSFYGELLKVVQKETFDCPICIETWAVERLVVTDCMHSICAACYNRLVNNMGAVTCPVCRSDVQKNSLLVHPKYRKNRETKLQALLDEIGKTPKEDKIIIFCQFNNLVTSISEQL